MCINLERYNRQIILKEFGISGQEKINKAKVLIVGAGGLGSVISLYLTAAGIGTIGIIDDDIVSISNLQRQILYKENMLNKSKVECAKQILNELNSNTKIEIYNTKLTKHNAKDIIYKYDIVADGTDNIDSRLIINDKCLELAKPYVYGSICEFSGQVSVFNYKGSLNYRSLLSNNINPETFSQSSGVLGVLPCIIGGIETNEIIKIITGIGTVLTNKLFTIDLLTLKSNIFKLC